MCTIYSLFIEKSATTQMQLDINIIYHNNETAMSVSNSQNHARASTTILTYFIVMHPQSYRNTGVIGGSQIVSNPTGSGRK